MTSLRLIIISFIALFLSIQVQANTLTSLLQQGQESLASGHYREAENQLQQAESLAHEAQDNRNITLIKALQGYMALQRQDVVQAEQLLSTALEQAQKNTWLDLVTRIELYVGQFYDREQDRTQAQSYFLDAKKHAEQIHDQTLVVSSLYQLAKLAIENSDAKLAWTQLQQAKTLLTALPINPVSSQLWLNVGYQTLQLHLLAPNSDYLGSAFDSLDKALTQSKQFKLHRTQASALKHLATMYKQQQRPQEAVKLLLEGISIAQKDEANDVLIDLEWQLGQLYQAGHNQSEAIAAYRRAVKHIESIRLDIPVSYEKGRSSFRDTFAPIYLALADLLLQQSVTANPQQQQILLAEAQNSIELMKKSELEDYFQSRCDISATPINLKKTDSHAAAIYPISLADRVELIVYTADGLRRFSSPVPAKELEQQARLFSSNLRNYIDFQQSKIQAQLLYQWLISPIQTLLKQQQIDTLIYIPDGALRLVPLAALYDGKKFLLEDYAIVTSPGMSLIEAEATTYQKQEILLAGMSIPGAVVNDLPESLLGNLVEAIPTKTEEKRGLTRDLKRWIGRGQKRELTGAEKDQKTRELRELLKKPMVVEKLQQLLALPGVDSEIKQLANQNDMPYLLNENFSLASFTEALTAQSHKVLHIASHGFFGSTAEDSFIMTHDRILNLNQLESLLNSDYFKLHPIDLITLSACQTAEGDDRSPLGISGVAIKSKVHSALGSLWPVSDEATAQLMTHFYQALKKPNQTKAKALREAELSLLAKKEFTNPSFWSPFILVGNWL
jgi:CHAT domain-containing protein